MLKHKRLIGMLLTAVGLIAALSLPRDTNPYGWFGVFLAIGLAGVIWLGINLMFRAEKA